MKASQTLLSLAAAALVSGSAQGQCELPYLDRRATSIDALGDRVALGDPLADGAQAGTGSVTLLEPAPTGWAPAAILAAADGAGGDEFGFDVALGPGVAFCGAPGRDAARGAVDVYELGAGGWTFTQRLTGAGGRPGDQFGYSLDVDGDVLVVGAPRIVFSDSDPNGGSAHVFERVGGAWTETATLGVPGNASNGFGLAVAVADDMLVVGRPGFPIFNTAQDHDARVYERVGGTWTHVQTLVGSDPVYQQNDEFGFALDMTAERLVIGAAQDHGFAYVFDRTPQGWQEAVEFSSMLSGPFFFLGRSVALAGGRVFVGAPSTFQNSPSRTFVFAEGPGGWELERELRRSVSDAAILGFGNAAAFVGSEAWVLAQDGMGRAYRFAPAAGERYCTSSPNASGAPARISATGCASVGKNDLRLVAAPVPNTAGLFLYGGEPRALPFGAGTRCVGSDVGRLPLRPAQAGTLSIDVDASMLLGGVSAGSTRYFQAWFRNGGGGGFQLSDGLRVTFVP